MRVDIMHGTILCGLFLGLQPLAAIQHYLNENVTLKGQNDSGAELKRVRALQGPVEVAVQQVVNQLRASHCNWKQITYIINYLS